ncbi:MAG: hypothetical protein DMG97_33665 [Acidobacteria bacterium]|nr:MAG: hypothetical protein DMG97_33665 [Acidobacteriota bacterium]
MDQLRWRRALRCEPRRQQRRARRTAARPEVLVGNRAVKRGPSDDLTPTTTTPVSLAPKDRGTFS